MKEIKAIIQPFMLDKVLEALHKIAELPGCTVSQVRGYARSEAHRSGEADLGFAERTKLEIVVPDALVKKVAETVRTSARTGNKGDGEIDWPRESTRTGRCAKPRRGKSILACLDTSKTTAEFWT